jgi:hypothetical protein
MRAGSVPATVSKKPLARQSRTLWPSMSSRVGGDARWSRAVIDVEFGGAARQARVTLQVELAGSVVAAVAADAARVEDRLDVGRVNVIGRLRVCVSNAAAQGKDHRCEQAIRAQAKHDTIYGLAHAEGQHASIGFVK